MSERSNYYEDKKSWKNEIQIVRKSESNYKYDPFMIDLM